jgi:cytoskeletal protein CcmA (bactofilin family)
MRQKRNGKPGKQSTKAKLAGTTIISLNSKLEGNMETNGALLVDGTLRGTIKCGPLEITEHGNVDANVEAETAMVAGNFEGEMICKGKFTFFRAGKVKGKISYRTLSLEPGELHDGTVPKFK